MNQLLDWHYQGVIDLFFSDETGFSLTPNIPYGWQPIGQQIEIRSAKDRVMNVFGLLSPSGKLRCYTTKGSINSDYIIESIDEVANEITRNTVIVMDNAPWHTSIKMQEKQQEWEEKGLFLFFLPVYSPHLNLIETLWRKINRVAWRYEWLRPWHYQDAKTLRQAIFNIITKYNDEFCINFSKNFN